jgi:fructoselysine-6-P-deglycase FrlB-like protein
MNTKKQTAGDRLDHWITYQETMAQPGIWRSWAQQLEAHAAAMSAWLAARDHEEIWFCGAGTSAFIGDMLCSYLSRPASRIRYRSIPTTDLVSCPANYIVTDRRILVVSFGRSGDSSETIGTLDLLDAHMPGADRLHFTCNADGALANRRPAGPGEGMVVLLPANTNDLGFAMTSSYSTMLLSALACLDRDRPMPIAEALNALADAGDKVLQQALVLAQRDQHLPSRAVYLGSGWLTPSARESALKVLELTHGKIPTSWDSTLGFRHGPKAVVDPATKVFILVSSDPHTRRYDLDAVNEIKSQFGSHVPVVLGGGGIGADLEIPVIGNDGWSSVLYVLVAQVHAIVWSDALAMNVDNPFAEGNLSRVVAGVTLYPFVPGA